MTNKNITVGELFALQEEMNVVLTNKVSILTRYHFHELKKTVNSMVASALEIKDELIKQYGEDGQLKVYADEESKTINPKFQEFINEWNKVLAEEKELSFHPIELSTIEKVETEKPIEILFKLVA